MISALVFLISLADASLSIKSASFTKSNIAFGEKVASEMVVDGSSKLEIKYKTAKDVKPVIAAFVSENNQKSFALNDYSGDNKLTINLDSKEYEFFNQNPGLYTLFLYVPGEKKEYNVGVVNFNIPKPLFSNNMYNEFDTLHQIHHQFRKPEKMPHVMISTLFTAVVLSPWLFLLGGWSFFGVNIKNFPFNSVTEFFPAVGYFATLGFTLFSLFLYWTKLNGFQELGLLAVLSVPLSLFGQKMLAHLAAKNR